MYTQFALINVRKMTADKKGKHF